MAGNEGAMLPTQRPLNDEEVARVLAPLGNVRERRLLSGGTFSAVQGVDLADGTTVVVKTSVPVAALPDGRTPLLTYERDMLHSERDMLLRLAEVPGVPCPRVLLSDFTREVTDVDVVVMSMVPGTPWDTVAASMTPEANARAHETVGGIIAAIQSVGGDTFGYPAGDFALSGATWPAFFTMLIDSTVTDADAWGVDIEPDRLIDALTVSAQALAAVKTPTLVHNDLWQGNVLLDPATGEVHGVVDFERALFGDPLQDFCGADSMNTGPITPALLRGYERAGAALPWLPGGGTVTGFDNAADTRLTLYRLWSLSVQLIEIVPRGFSGDWVAGHRATINANRAELFERLDV